MTGHPTRLLVTTTLLLSILATETLRAEEESHTEEATHTTAHGHAAHAIGFFLGMATEEAGSRENGVALGIEYERRLTPQFGIGGIVEHTYGDLDVWVYAVSFAYHNGPWRLYAAPGIEDTHHGSEKMLRLGIEYGIDVGEWEIAPQFDIDFVEREAVVLVLGFTFARELDF